MFGGGKPVETGTPRRRRTFEGCAQDAPLSPSRGGGTGRQRARVGSPPAAMANRCWASDTSRRLVDQRHGMGVQRFRPPAPSRAANAQSWVAPDAWISAATGVIGRLLLAPVPRRRGNARARRQDRGRATRCRRLRRFAAVVRFQSACARAVAAYSPDNSALARASYGPWRAVAAEMGKCGLRRHVLDDSFGAVGDALLVVVNRSAHATVRVQQRHPSDSGLCAARSSAASPAKSAARPHCSRSTAIAPPEHSVIARFHAHRSCSTPTLAQTPPRRRRRRYRPSPATPERIWAQPPPARQADGDRPPDVGPGPARPVPRQQSRWASAAPTSPGWG